MGSYSYYEYEDIEIKDQKGLIAYIEQWNKIFVEHSYLTRNMIENIQSEDKKCIVLFEAWNSYKIIQYWYEPMVCFLRGIAKFIEGEVVFIHETNEERAKIIFNEGTLTVELGRMEYKTFDSDGLIGNDHDQDHEKYIAFLTPYLI